MTRRMLALLLGVAFALTVTVGVGWTRYARYRPPSAGVASRTVPLVEGGVRYQVIGMQRLQRIEFAESEPLIARPGETWLRLDVRLELVDPDASIETLHCSGFLVAQGNEWLASSEPAMWADDLGAGQCHRGGGISTLGWGNPKTITLHWLVPTWAATSDPQFFLRFSTPPRSIELRP